MSETPDYIIPEELHTSSIKQVIDFLRDYPTLKLEITSEDSKFNYRNFRGLKGNKNIIKCDRFSQPAELAEGSGEFTGDPEVEDGWTILSRKLEIEYIALVNKTLLYKFV